MKLDKHTVITFGILGGLVVGVALGQVVFTTASPAGREAAASAFRFIGTTFFMNLLKMVLIPLVASSVIVGVASIGDRSALGKAGGLTLLYYLSTMLGAVVLGLVLVTTIAPGHGIDRAVVEAGQRYQGAEQARSTIEAHAGEGPWSALRSIAAQLVPDNPFAAAAAGQILPIITSSLLFGVVLTAIGEKARALLAFFESLFSATMKLVEWILWLAPLGVLFLVADAVAGIGFAELAGPLLLYMFTVVLGLALHGLVVLPAVLYAFGRCNPFRFMHQMRAALMTAFGTDSSSATLPVTIEAAELHGGVSKRAAGFVLPLGATINMDGTALYEAVAVVFLFQCYGIELHATELALVAITATLAAVGAAGIPSAGLVTMVLVVQAVNGALGPGIPKLPLAAIGVVLGVDRILDMCRTTVNVWGDAVGAKILTRIMPD